VTAQPSQDDRYSWDDAYSSAPPITVLLPALCWLIDRDDDWETYHHPTREDAEHEHADRVRSSAAAGNGPVQSRSVGSRTTTRIGWRDAASAGSSS